MPDFSNKKKEYLHIISQNVTNDVFKAKGKLEDVYRFGVYEIRPPFKQARPEPRRARCHGGCDVMDVPTPTPQQYSKKMRTHTSEQYWQARCAKSNVYFEKNTLKRIH